MSFKEILSPSKLSSRYQTALEVAESGSLLLTAILYDGLLSEDFFKTALRASSKTRSERPFRALLRARSLREITEVSTPSEHNTLETSLWGEITRLDAASLSSDASYFQTLASLGLMYCQRGEFELAEAIAVELLVRLEAEFGIVHPATADGLLFFSHILSLAGSDEGSTRISLLANAILERCKGVTESNAA